MTTVDLIKMEIGDIIVLRDGTHHVVKDFDVDKDGDYDVLTKTERLYEGTASKSWFHRPSGKMTGENFSSADIVQIISNSSSVGIKMHEMPFDKLENSKMSVVQSGYDENMNGKHYKRGGIESIEVIEAWELGFNLGNVIKYLSRAGVKTSDALPCLKKARWYIDREISNREKNK